MWEWVLCASNLWVSEWKSVSPVRLLRPQGLYTAHGILKARILEWSLSLLQGIFPTQRLNPGLLHCGQILYQLSHKGSPRILQWVAYPFASGSSQLRNQTGVSCIAGGFFTSWAMREAVIKRQCFCLVVNLLIPGIVGRGEFGGIVTSDNHKTNSVCSQGAGPCAEWSLLHASYHFIPEPSISSYHWTLCDMIPHRITEPSISSSVRGGCHTSLHGVVVL